MASRDCQSEVVELLADERGLSTQKVKLSDRLLQDLGMDGDDAVDFFNSLHERFGTDLTHLQEHWSEHFGPEGFSCWNGLVIIPAAVIGGVVAGVAGLSTFWALAITVTLLVAWLLAMRRWGLPTRWSPLRSEKWWPLLRLVLGLPNPSSNGRNGWIVDIRAQSGSESD